MSNEPRRHIPNPLTLLRRIPVTPLEGTVQPERIVPEVPDDGRPDHIPNWIITDLFCPYCGQQPIHEEHGYGDEYCGTVHWCCSCRTRFYLP